MTDSKVELLRDAEQVLIQRGEEYGPVASHHTSTAQACNAILGTELNPSDVALIFAIDKLVRRRTSPKKRDHYLDGANYIAIAWEHEGG